MSSIVRFCSIFLILISATVADIVPGKCPKVSGTKFNCTEVLQNFYDNNGETVAHLLIYGFLSSSPDSQSINVFGFDFQNGVSISDYFIRFSCASNKKYDENHFIIDCNVGSLFNYE